MEEGQLRQQEETSIPKTATAAWTDGDGLLRVLPVDPASTIEHSARHAGRLCVDF